MSKTMSFVQRSSKSTDRRRAQAAALLRGVAAKAKSPELSVIASSVELDAFAKVKKAIDEMVTALKTEQADEVKHHDYCKDELHQVEVDSMNAEQLKTDLEAKQGDLEISVK